MAAGKKKTSPATRRRRKTGAGSTQLKQLRAAVKQMRIRLGREARRRQRELRALADTKKARAHVLKQVGALRSQGVRLAAQLHRALGDAKSRERARTQALAKVEELRRDLKIKTDELRRKSTELAKLAAESGLRAHEIVHSSAPVATAIHAPETTAPMIASLEPGGEPPRG